MDADLVSTLTPIGELLAVLDLSDVASAKSALQAQFDDERMYSVSKSLLAAHAAGTLTPRSGGPSVSFGRVVKAANTAHGHSIDAVDISGPGASHGHPKGEVSWCIPLEGEPEFEGARAGWVVLPPGSAHTPTVTGGRMLIVYFLPDGAVDWSV